MPALRHKRGRGAAEHSGLPLQHSGFDGTRILVAHRSYLGGGEHHAILDVAVGERDLPVFVPEGAGTRA